MRRPNEPTGHSRHRGSPLRDRTAGVVLRFRVVLKRGPCQPLANRTKPTDILRTPTVECRSASRRTVAWSSASFVLLYPAWRRPLAHARDELRWLPLLHALPQPAVSHGQELTARHLLSQQREEDEHVPQLSIFPHPSSMGPQVAFC